MNTTASIHPAQKIANFINKSTGFAFKTGKYEKASASRTRVKFAEVDMTSRELFTKKVLKKANDLGIVALIDFNAKDSDGVAFTKIDIRK